LPQLIVTGAQVDRKTILHLLILDSNTRSKLKPL
jgi:hypothetical protein